MPLKPDDIIGRRLELLGRAQGIDTQVLNQVTPIFTCGNMDFRSGLGRIYVAYIIMETADGLTIPASSASGFGVAPNYADWCVANPGIAPWMSPASLPIILYPQIGAAQSFQPPVYANGAAFGMKNILVGGGGGGAGIATVSCWGWAAN